MSEPVTAMYSLFTVFFDLNRLSDVAKKMLLTRKLSLHFNGHFSDRGLAGTIMSPLSVLLELTKYVGGGGEN